MEKNIENSEEKLNFEIIINFYLRNKRLMIKFIAFFFLLFSAYAAIKKPRWEGQFEIVLNQKQENER